MNGERLIIGVPVIRRYDLLWRFLKSLERNWQPDKGQTPFTYVDYHDGKEKAFTGSPTRAYVIVVDNGGQYDAQPWRSVAPLDPMVLRPGRNVGCSGAWNLLLDQATSDEMVLIANDDIMLSEHSIGRILSRTTVETSVGQFTKPDFVAAHGFSLFLIRKQLVDELGPFDENFFPAYFEDNDFEYRMKLAGKRFHVVDGCAQHTGSASLHIQSDAAQREFGKRFEQLRSYYVKKWGGKPTEERFTKPFNGDLPPGWRLRPETG